MSISSGEYVKWDEGEGRTLNIFKGADPDDPLARIRVFKDGQPTDTVLTVSLSKVEASHSPVVEQTLPTVQKTASNYDLEQNVAKLSEVERTAMATFLFSQTLPQLPNIIVGEEGSREPFDGVGRATNGL